MKEMYNEGILCIYSFLCAQIYFQQALQSRAEFFEAVMIGKVEAADGDRNDTTWTIR